MKPSVGEMRQAFTGTGIWPADPESPFGIHTQTMAGFEILVALEQWERKGSDLSGLIMKDTVDTLQPHRAVTARCNGVDIEKAIPQLPANTVERSTFKAAGTPTCAVDTYAASPQRACAILGEYCSKAAGEPILH